MEKHRTIGNVNILDLRKATEATVAEISEIGNVNVLLYSPETAGLVTRLNVGNINATVEVPAGADTRLVMGPMTISRGYFEGLATPQHLVVLGPVMVEADVPAEAIEQGLGGLVVVGPITYPEQLQGVVQSKLIRLIGPAKSYPRLGKAHSGSLVLDAEYLQALADGTELAVLGNLRVPGVLPNDLVERKLGKLFVSGKVECHEENLAAIRSRLLDGSGNVRVIPAGFELVERPLVLDNALLPLLPARKLYCTERVQVAPDVEAAVLDKYLEALVAREMVLCPVALREVLAHKCDLLKTQVVFYEGALWLIDSSSTLTAPQFDYLEGKATLVVLGELKVDPAVDPQVLAGRLAKVHNLGMIRCTPAQAAALQSRLGLSEGEIEGAAAPKEEAEGDQVGNVNYLAL